MHDTLNLFLASDKLGGQEDLFMSMIHGPGNVGLIANAGDGFEDRSKYVQEHRDMLESLGLSVDEIDLRDFHDQDDDAIVKRIADNIDVLYVPGGHALELNANMHMSGLNHHIGHIAMIPGLLYAGYSAGSCVTAPLLYGIEKVDTLPELTEKSLAVPALFKGLALRRKLIIPHLDSPGNNISKLMPAMLEAVMAQNLPYDAMRDDHVITRLNGRERYHYTVAT